MRRHLVSTVLGCSIMLGACSSDPTTVVVEQQPVPDTSLSEPVDRPESEVDDGSNPPVAESSSPRIRPQGEPTFPLRVEDFRPLPEYSARMLAVIAEARELWNQSGIENYRTSVRVDLPNESDWKPVWIESEVRGDENRQLSLVPPSPGDEVELFRLADQFSVDPTIEPAYGRDNDATVESWFMFLEQHVLYHVWLGPPDETAANNPEIDDWVLAGFTEPITFHPTHGYPTRFAAHWWMSFAEYSLERFDLLGSAAPACSTSGRTVSTSPTDVSPAADLTRSLVLEALSSCDPLLLQATYDYLKPAADDDLSVHFAGDSGGRTLTMLFDALSGEPEVRDGLLRWNPSREGDPVVRIEASGRWDIGRRS